MGEGAVAYVNLRSWRTSYLRLASCSMIFLPSACFSGSSTLETERWTSSMAWVCTGQKGLSCGQISILTRMTGQRLRTESLAKDLGSEVTDWAVNTTVSDGSAS